MQLTVNDKLIDLEENFTISKFIEWYKQQDKLPQNNFAIAINMEFVPRSLYSETILKSDDKVEIVLPMQGG